MDSRNLSTIEFDRFTLHTMISENFEAAINARIAEVDAAEKIADAPIQEALAELKATLAETEENVGNAEKIKDAKDAIAKFDYELANTFSEVLQSDYKKLAIYFAFGNQRNLKSALKYLNKYKATIKEHDTFEYAEVLSLIGYANTMHPDFGKKEGDEVDLLAAIKLFEELREKAHAEETINRININLAFAHRYRALCLRRKPDANITGTKSNLELAIEGFETVLAMQEALITSFPLIKLDIAETNHLIGVTKIAQGKKQEALPFLESANKLEEEFIAETHAAHFIKWITGQSLGLLYKDLNRFDESVALLKQTAIEQQKYFGTPVQADHAKTICFLGEVYASNPQTLSEAVLYLEEGIKIKKSFYQASDFVLTITQKALIDVFNRSFTFDWNDYRTIANNETKNSKILEFVDGLPAHDVLKLNAKDAQAYGQLLYKLGSYQIHICQNHEGAKELLQKAKVLVTDKFILAWVNVHLAFCLQKITLGYNKELAKMIDLDKGDVDEAVRTIIRNEVHRLEVARVTAADETAKIYDHVLNSTQTATSIAGPNFNIEAVKIVGFAYCIKAYNQYENNERASGVASLEHAIHLYEEHELQNDGDQYARALLRYTNMMEETNQLNLAEEFYTKLAKHWQDHTDKQPNPHQAKFHECYGKFLEKKEVIQEAINQFASAQSIHVRRNATDFQVFCEKKIVALTAKLSASTPTPVISAPLSPASLLRIRGLHAARANAQDAKIEDELNKDLRTGMKLT